MPQPWHIYHIADCRHARPAPKDKFVVVVCKDSKYMGFFINSAIHPFIQNQPELLAAEASIDAANHSCLSKDSYVDCNDLYAFEDFELQNDRGAVSLESKKRIQEAVSKAMTIAKHFKDLIVP